MDKKITSIILARTTCSFGPAQPAHRNATSVGRAIPDFVSG
jgi:hypothetical protein